MRPFAPPPPLDATITFLRANRRFRPYFGTDTLLSSPSLTYLTLRLPGSYLEIPVSLPWQLKNQQKPAPRWRTGSRNLKLLQKLLLPVCLYILVEISKPCMALRLSLVTKVASSSADSKYLQAPAPLNKAAR